MTLHGAIILGVWVVCLPVAFRVVLRAMLAEAHPPDALIAILCAVASAIMALSVGPLIVAYKLATFVWTGDDVLAFTRALAGESRESKRNRLRREIEELDEELGLS